MKNSNGLLYLIIILIVANLCGTLWLISKTTSSSPQAAIENETLDKTKLIEEFDKSIAIYNSGEKEALWNMFSDYAKSQMNKENSIKTIVNLKTMFGNIKSGTYMYQKFAGKKGNLIFHTAHFTVNLIDSNIGDKAILILTVSSDGSIIELVGFHLKTK